MSVVRFGSATFELRCAGTIWWEEEGMLIVSDLHLEKGSSFSLRGFFLPPHDTHDTLARLGLEVDEKRPRRLVLLGDSFHDPSGYHRLRDDDRAVFESMLRRQETVWINGNHEKGFVPAGVAAMDAYKMRDIVFRHEHSSDPALEVSGHFHPKAEFHHKGHRVRGRCFVLTGDRLIMPSFGSYTGGLSVKDRAMEHVLGSEFDVVLCAERRVFRLPSTLLDG